jgi:hypothetical protein
MASPANKQPLMNNRQKADVKAASIVGAIIPVGAAALITFDYDSAFPALLYFSVGMTIIGLLVSATIGKRLPGDTLRWRAAINVMLSALAIYTALAIIASVREASGLLSFGLTFAAILFLPLALFVGYIVSFMLISSERD